MSEFTIDELADELASQLEEQGTPDISVVIPLFNEQESIPHLCERLTSACEGSGYSFEVIIVDDGSNDRSYELLRDYATQDERYKIIRLRRNFGQTAAFSAGFDAASGDVIITMDADLQNDPADIPLLMSKVEEGYDIVSRLAQRSAGSLPGPQAAVHDRQSDDLQRYRRPTA